MNPLDDQLARLFRAAAKAKADPVPEAPYGLETRALAAWRGRGTVQGGFWDMTVLARGLIAAALIMAASFLPTLKSTESTSNPFAEYVQLTDSTVAADETP